MQLEERGGRDCRCRARARGRIELLGPGGLRHAGFLFALHTSVALADCSLPELEACEIPAHMCRLWTLPCAQLSIISLDLSVGKGAVQVYLFTNATGRCNGSELAPLCGYPQSVARCQEDHLVQLGGECMLSLLNTGSAGSVAVDGVIGTTVAVRGRAGRFREALRQTSAALLSAVEQALCGAAGLFVVYRLWACWRRLSAPEHRCDPTCASTVVSV